MSNTTPTETATEETTEEMAEEVRSGEKEEKKKSTRRPRKEKPPKEPRVKKWADDPIAYSKRYYQEKVKKHTVCETCKAEFTSVCAYKHHQKHNKSCKLKKLLDDNGITEPFEIKYHYEEPNPWQTMLSRYMGYETDESSEG